MKTLYLILLLALLTGTAALCQNVYIPDANFKAALLANTVINTNGDSEIQITEAEAYSGGIYVSSKNISDLTGIETFINLTGLDCYCNQLTTLDVSYNIFLQNLNCGKNQLTGINISHNTQLISFECSYNQLTNIDVSYNLQLIYLRCDYNQFDSLDISNNTLIAHLSCFENNLVELDISNNTQLIYLWCGSNNLTTIDVSNNTLLNEFDCYNNSLTNIDVSNNTLLTYFDCSYNLLTDVDISNNLQLEVLGLYVNQLTSIDVSNNTQLISLWCYNNQLTTFDISNNKYLSELYCEDNQLTSLDVSNNPYLSILFCNNNQLTSLDVSNNSQLTSFVCSFNILTSLNLRNGNNAQLLNFNAESNPNLTCIEVDIVPLALSKPEWHIDSTAVYRTDCNLTNHIYGSFLFDSDCNINGNETGYKGIIVKTEPAYHYGISRTNGDFDILTDTGSFMVEPVISHPLIEPFCPDPFIHTVSFDTLEQDTSGIVFFAETTPCPLMTIDISSNRRRRCMTSNTYIEYCNNGFASAGNVLVHVRFPNYVGMVSANQSYTVDSLGNYVFDVGTVQAQACGTIIITDSVSCIFGITGLTQCTQAWITPGNDCLYNLDTAIQHWDHSSIHIPEGECIGDSIVRFVIINGGDDMQSPSEYRIYADNLLVYTDQFQLQADDSLVVEVYANGQTVRIEADQHPNHPGNSHPNAVVEGCGYGGAPLTVDMVNQMPSDDEDFEIEIDCMPITDSYDPNDKAVSPSGIGMERIVHPGTMLEYMIRFQNTGSDTAYMVMVVDTLSEYFDLSTIQWGLASAPYTLEVEGQGKPVLSFTFNNINLPDSATNEEASIGFIKFKVKPLASLPNGTIINNTAHIYFDYNMPVATHNAWIMISDSVPEGPPIIIVGMDALQRDARTWLHTYPNPAAGELFIELKTEKQSSYSVYSIDGQKLFDGKLKSGINRISTKQLESGMYFMEIENGLRKSVSKIVISK